MPDVGGGGGAAGQRESCVQCGSLYCSSQDESSPARGCLKRRSTSQTVPMEDESLTSKGKAGPLREDGKQEEAPLLVPEPREQSMLCLGADNHSQQQLLSELSSEASILMQVENNAERLARLKNLVDVILSESSLRSPSEELGQSPCSAATGVGSGSGSDNMAQMLSEGLKSVLQSLKEESYAVLNESESETPTPGNPESTANSVLKLLGELEILLMAKALSKTESQHMTRSEPEGILRGLAGDSDPVSKMAGDSQTKSSLRGSKHGTADTFTTTEDHPPESKPNKAQAGQKLSPAGKPQCRPRLKGSGHSTSSCDNAWKAKSRGGQEGGRAPGTQAGMAWQQLKVSSSSSQESWERERGQGKSVSTLEDEDWRASKQEALKGLSGSQQMIETLKAAQQEVRSLPDHQLKRLLAKYLGEGEGEGERENSGHCLCCPLHPKNTKSTLFKDYLYLLRSYGFYMGRFDPTPVPGQPPSHGGSHAALPDKARGEGDSSAVQGNSSEDSSTLWSTAESFTSVSSINKPKSKTRVSMTSSMIKSLENFLRHKKKNKTSNSQSGPSPPSRKDSSTKDTSETDQQGGLTSDCSQSQSLLQQDSETTVQGERHGGGGGGGGKYMSPEFKRAAKRFILYHQGRTSSVHTSQEEKEGLSETSCVRPQDVTEEQHTARDEFHDLFVESLKQLEGRRGETEAQSLGGTETSSQGSQHIKLRLKHGSNSGRKIPTKIGGRFHSSDAYLMAESNSPTNREKSLDRQSQARGLEEINRRSPTDGKRPGSRATSGDDHHQQKIPVSCDLSLRRDGAGSPRPTSVRSSSQSRKGKKEHSKPQVSLTKINHYFSRMRDSGNETSQTENSLVSERKAASPTARNKKSWSDAKESEDGHHPSRSPLAQSKTSAQKRAGLGADGHQSPPGTKIPSPSNVMPRLSKLPKATPTSGSGGGGGMYHQTPEHSKTMSSPKSSQFGRRDSSLKRHSMSATPVSKLSGPNSSEQSGINLSPAVSTPQLQHGVSQESALESLCSVTAPCSTVPMFYSAWPCPIPVPCSFVSSTCLPTSQTLLPVAYGADCLLNSHLPSPPCSRSMQGLYLTSPQPHDMAMNWAASFQAQNPTYANSPPPYNHRSHRHLSQSPGPGYSPTSPSPHYQPLKTSSTGSSIPNRTQSVSPSRIPVKKAYSTLSKCMEPVKRAYSASPHSHSFTKLHACQTTPQSPKLWSQYFIKAGKQDGSADRGASSQWRSGEGSSSLCSSPVLVSRSKPSVSPAHSDPPVVPPSALPFSAAKPHGSSAKSFTGAGNLASDLKRFFGARHKSHNDGATQQDKGARSIKWSKNSAIQYSLHTKDIFTDALDKCQSSSQSLKQLSPPPAVWFAAKAERNSRPTKRTQGGTKIPKGEKKELRQPGPKGLNPRSLRPKLGSASRFAEGRRHGSASLSEESVLAPRKDERRKSKVVGEGSTTLASASPMSPGLAIRYKAFISGSVDYENLLFDCFK